MKKSSLPRLSSTKLEKLWDSFLSSRSRVYLQDFGVSLLIVFLLLIMTRHPTSLKGIPVLVEGQLAPHTIRVSESLELPDYAANALEKERLLRNVPNVYDYDPQAIKKAVTTWQDAVRTARAINASNKVRARVFASRVKDDVSITASELRLLARLGFSPQLEASVDATLVPLSDFRIIEDSSELRRGMEVFNLENKQSELLKGRVVGTVLSEDDLPSTLRDALRDNMRSGSKRWRFWTNMSLKDRRALVQLHSKFISSNVTLNKKESEKKRIEALENFRPLIKKVLKGEVVVREGERVKKHQAEILRVLRQRAQKGLPVAEIIFEALFGALCFSLFTFFVRSQFPRMLSNQKDTIVSVFILLVSLAAFKLTLIFQLEVLAEQFSNIPTAFFLFMLPVATSAMIIRFLMRAQIAVVYSFLFGLGTAVMMEKAALYGAFAISACLAGSFFLQRCRSRNELYRAGLYSALIMGAAAMLLVLAWGGNLPVSSELLNETGSRVTSTFVTALWAFFGGVLGGLVSAALTLVFTPIIESLLDYTTDLKLIELARMDNPLLRDLVLKAPGTYHHSILVGSLCEAACEAIGANPLLARVGAYYHDIGKIGRSEYFVENQTSGINPHDNMKPQLSAKIIISHVKEGRLMAKKHKLGQNIVDFIEQHHGRNMVSYFFNKAKQMAAQPGSEVDPEEIKEDDYRYPGPKPRSKEAVIMALADSCEAATRSLVDPTPARIEAMVNKILTKAFDEGLLEDAEITLREVYLVGKAFNRILLGVHHHRVEYPDQEESLPPSAQVSAKKHLKTVK